MLRFSLEYDEWKYNIPAQNCSVKTQIEWGLQNLIWV